MVGLVAPSPPTPPLLLKHVLQWPRQELEHGVQDALLVLLIFVPAACRDRLLGARERALARLLHRCLLLRLLLLLLLQAVLGTQGRGVAVRLGLYRLT